MFEQLATTQCIKCKHVHSSKIKKQPSPMSCEAFPNGIPSDILNGKISHTKHIPGDNGIKFEKRK